MLDERDVRVALRCVSELLDTRRLRGAPIPGWLSEHYRRVKAMSADGGTAVRHDAPNCDDDESIGSAEVAAMLGISDRRVREIAEALDGIKPARNWVFSRAAVERYAEERQEQ